MGAIIAKDPAKLKTAGKGSRNRQEAPGLPADGVTWAGWQTEAEEMLTHT